MAIVWGSDRSKKTIEFLMSRAVRGAKKFINSRRRFHERMTLRKLNPDEDSV